MIPYLLTLATAFRGLTTSGTGWAESLNAIELGSLPSPRGRGQGEGAQEEGVGVQAKIYPVQQVPFFGWSIHAPLPNPPPRGGRGSRPRREVLIKHRSSEYTKKLCYPDLLSSMEAAMYAIIETGGKQYRVQPGDEIHVEKIPSEVGETVNIDSVLMYADGERLSVGTPTVENVQVKGRVLAHGRDKKVIIYKLKRRKKYRRKRGHRQAFTVLKIDEITVEQ